MRTHADIIAQAGGFQSLAERLGQPANRVRFWERRKSIPPGQWTLCAEVGVATLAELAEAVAVRRGAAVSAPAARAAS